MKTYAEKLKSPLWQRKRLEIMQRDGFKCRTCGNEEQTLNIHHIRYLPNREPWDYHDWYLVTLCYDCHKMEESILRGEETPAPKPTILEEVLVKPRERSGIF